MTTVSPHETPGVLGLEGAPPSLDPRESQSSTCILPDLRVLLSTMCYHDSPHFIMYGTSEMQLNTALNTHGLMFEGLSFELRRQALCHHLLNRLCFDVTHHV